MSLPPGHRQFAIACRERRFQRVSLTCATHKVAIADLAVRRDLPIVERQRNDQSADHRDRRGSNSVRLQPNTKYINEFFNRDRHTDDDERDTVGI